MNALSPAASPLTKHAVENIALLQALDTPDRPFESVAEFARAVGRDKDNLRKTLRFLTDSEGLLVWRDGMSIPALADPGRAALDAWDRANAPPVALALDPNGHALVPLDLIDPWPDQPRKAPRSEAGLEDLAVSIADKGVEQAITLRPRDGGRFQVVIGAGRLEAAQLAQSREWLPADYRIPARIEDLDDEEAFERAVVENVQREDLHWMDEAKAMLKMHLPRPEGMGRSAAQIARVFGNRGKRSIQDYTKIARELAPEDVARTYLPDGDPERLTYVKARDMVGEKREKLALDLSPKLAMTFVELIHAGQPVPGGVMTMIHRPPAGGPMPGLAERQLIAWRFQDGQPAAYVPIDDRVSQYLAQVGYIADPAAALHALRVAALGELEAHQHRTGYVTAELNAPVRETAEQLAREVFGAPEDKDAGGYLVPPAPDGDDEDVPDFLRSLAGPGEAPPPQGEGDPEAVEAASELPPVPEGYTRHHFDQAAPPAPTPEPKPLPPLLALVVVEVAAKTCVEGVERAPGVWGAPIGADWHRDARIGVLIQQHGLLTIMAMGATSLVCLTAKAWQWLADECDWLARPGDAPIEDHQRLTTRLWLRDMQTRFAGQPPVEGQFWLLTPWLFIPEVAAPPDTPSPSPARPAPPQVAELQRVLASYDGLLGQVDALLARCAIASKPPKADIEQIRKMIENTREVGKPFVGDR